MNKDEILELYRNLAITNAEEFWEYTILEHIADNFENNRLKELNITKEKIYNMIDNIMANDKLWEEIDYAIENAISEEC